MKNVTQYLSIFSFILALSLIPHIASAKTVTLVLDVSKSNPLLNDKRFNQRAADYLSAHIASLEKGDKLVLSYVGSLNDPENFPKGHVEITRHNTKKVVRSVRHVISSLSKQVTPQGSTNLIAYWGRNDFDCANGGQVIALTDGIEASEYASPKKLLSGEASLPKPNETVQLKGCDVYFFGLGVGRSDREALRLRRQWQAYFDAAGARFEAIFL